MKFRLGKFSLTDGSIVYDNFRVSAERKHEDIIDFNHLNFQRI